MIKNKVNTLLVWDLPTRLFHWALVCSIVYAWVSVEILEDMEQHFYAGYSVLTLILFRLIWGLIGSKYSRLKRLFFPLSETLKYAKGLFSRKSTAAKNQEHLGHNPLGSLSVIAILSILLIQATLGMFSTDGYVFGPLAGLLSAETRDQITQLHLDNIVLIYAILGLHVAAIFFHQVVKKENLTRTMITGKKAGESAHPETHKSPWLALAILILCAGFVYWLSTAYLDLIPLDDFGY
ncbi:cytochrome b/b6 domain-containing protein [Arenicella sp. 4NH20-0111]|uniref:cytochrome b/b6 domain-containing protein n=1 Tax=Arenicella sp. 4NH20-0111 TaxID=3127648 RepID=UPI003340885C